MWPADSAGDAPHCQAIYEFSASGKKVIEKTVNVPFYLGLAR